MKNEQQNERKATRVKQIIMLLKIVDCFNKDSNLSIITQFHQK
jgi:hypothetical protein